MADSFLSSTGATAHTRAIDQEDSHEDSIEHRHRLLPLCHAAVAAASTPDDLPPSAEDVCDAEEGRAKGLCTAYCEAMDCDDDPNANVNACNKTKAKWQEATGRTEMPCEVSSCPCAEYPLWDAVLSEDTFPFACYEDEQTAAALWVNLGYTDDGVIGAGLDGEFQNICIVGSFATGEAYVLPVDPAQGAACAAEVSDWIGYWEALYPEFICGG